MWSKNGVELWGRAPIPKRLRGPVPLSGSLRRGIPEGVMQSEDHVVLLVGSDPDVLFLRSAVLASAGIWSLRVRNAQQAIEVLGDVAFDAIVICYMLDQENQQQ